MGSVLSDLREREAFATGSQVRAIGAKGVTRTHSRRNPPDEKIHAALTRATEHPSPHAPVLLHLDAFGLTGPGAKPASSRMASSEPLHNKRLFTAANFGNFDHWRDRAARRFPDAAKRIDRFVRQSSSALIDCLPLGVPRRHRRLCMITGTLAVLPAP